MKSGTRTLSRWLALLALGIFAAAGPSTAGWLDKEVVFSEAEVQARIDKSTPLEKRYGDLISVALAAPPRITLGSPIADKAGLKAQAEISLLGQRPIPVELAGTAGVRYDDQQKAFYLEEPNFDQIDSPGLEREAKPAIRRAVNKLLGNYFRSRPIYVLRENGTPQEATARWLLRSVRIEPGRVVAVLSPF